ncbi:MAG: MBL fold metallo-hydrolase [Bacteroidota bacterium]
MKRILKLFKMIGLTILSLIVLVVVIGALFINLSPQFGGKATDSQKANYAKYDNYADGKFINEVEANMDMGAGNMLKVMREFLRSDPSRQPGEPQPIETITSQALEQNPDSVTRVSWFGHSAFLLQIDGVNLLLDPMLGKTPSPHPWMGTKRYTDQLPINIEELPHIDAVLISHDHYDHLDYESIVKLRDKVDAFFVPLGVGAHFVRWGVPEEKITEHNWWEESQFEGLTLACTPARHFSGRGLTDRMTTLWSSWVIIGQQDTIYFSGDSSYGPHFKEIGEKYGPFDFAMMECGQYNKMWKDVHMMPEETAQAGVDVKAKLLMPIHWGAFTLALHSWTDPIERVSKKAKELGLTITTPKIGEPIFLRKESFPTEPWWEDVK